MDDDFAVYGVLRPVQDPAEQQHLVQTMRHVFASFHPWHARIFTDAIPRRVLQVCDT